MARHEYKLRSLKIQTFSRELEAQQARADKQIRQLRKEASFLNKPLSQVMMRHPSNLDPADFDFRKRQKNDIRFHALPLSRKPVKLKPLNGQLSPRVTRSAMKFSDPDDIPKNRPRFGLSKSLDQLPLSSQDSPELRKTYKSFLGRDAIPEKPIVIPPGMTEDGYVSPSRVNCPPAGNYSVSREFYLRRSMQRQRERLQMEMRRKGQRGHGAVRKRLTPLAASMLSNEHRKSVFH